MGDRMAVHQERHPFTIFQTPSANKQTKFHGINTANLGYFVLSYSGGTIRVNRKRTVIQQRQLAK
jgi:hypothetical protein